MSPTLLEWAIAVLLVLIAWQIGAILARRILPRIKERRDSKDKKNKPPQIIDV